MVIPPCSKPGMPSVDEGRVNSAHSSGFKHLPELGEQGSRFIRATSPNCRPDAQVGSDRLEANGEWGPKLCQITPTPHWEMTANEGCRRDNSPTSQDCVHLHSRSIHTPDPLSLARTSSHPQWSLRQRSCSTCTHVHKTQLRASCC